MIRKSVRILKEVDMEPTLPGDTREIFKLKGKQGKAIKGICSWPPFLQRIFSPYESMQWDVKFFRIFQIGIDKRDHLVDHLFGHVFGKSIFLDVPFFMSIAVCKLRKKHVIIVEIHVENIGRIHTASASCYDDQTSYLVGQSQFGKCECIRSVHQRLCEAGHGPEVNWSCPNDPF